MRKYNNTENIVSTLFSTQKIVFVGSIDEDGFPNMKAMLAPRERFGFRVLFFTTNTSSMRVRQFRANPKACVYLCDPLKFHGVMLRGTMEVLEDPASKELIWRPGDEVYYPLGVTDPDYCVLRFTATDGRFYHDFSSENFTV